VTTGQQVFATDRCLLAGENLPAHNTKLRPDLRRRPNHLSTVFAPGCDTLFSSSRIVVSLPGERSAAERNVQASAEDLRFGTWPTSLMVNELQ
jgi:hypothetical protein